MRQVGQLAKPETVKKWLAPVTLANLNHSDGLLHSSSLSSLIWSLALTRALLSAYTSVTPFTHATETCLQIVVSIWSHILSRCSGVLVNVKLTGGPKLAICVDMNPTLSSHSPHLHQSKAKEWKHNGVLYSLHAPVFWAASKVGDCFGFCVAASSPDWNSRTQLSAVFPPTQLLFSNLQHDCISTWPIRPWSFQNAL